MKTAIETLRQLQFEWNPLLERSPLNNLFLTWEWIDSWCKNMLQNEIQIILTVRKKDRLVGIAPLLLIEDKEMGNQVQFIGQKYSYHLGFIADKEFEIHVYNAIWDYLFNNLPYDFSSIEFRHFEQNDVFETSLQSQKKKRGIIVESSIQNPCKVLAINGSYKNYLKHGIVSWNFRRNIIKDINHIEKEGKIIFIQADASNFHAYWFELLKLHREMMQSKNKHSALNGVAFPQHLFQVGEAFQKKNSLRLNVMFVNNTTAAILFAINYNGVYNALTIGVNQKLIEKMPWFNFTIHSIANGIKSAFDENCKEFDFLGGQHDYKDKMGGKDQAGILLKIWPAEKVYKKEVKRSRFESILTKMNRIFN